MSAIRGGMGNIKHRTPNIDHRSEEKRKKRTNPELQRLNPDLPVEAIEGAVEVGILNVGFWILNGKGGRKKVPRRRRFPDFTKSDNFTFC